MRETVQLSATRTDRVVPHDPVRVREDQPGTPNRNNRYP